MAVKSYGTILKKGSTSVGEIISVGVPEIIQEAVETTNHSSNGWKTFIPSGLKELGEFELTLIAGSTVFNTIYADMTGETVAEYTVDYPTGSTNLTDWSFMAFPTSVKIEDMDATKPEAMTFKVKFQSSGSLTVAVA